ncbi:hypothetical protein, partial [Pseudomonas sp. RIT-PI-AD]|uniref:hypothetical protein n=1 Tax=Pseudomonas sp. RIT-PI-AD TaxID=3035294 RepID=UPI0021DB14CA
MKTTYDLKRRSALLGLGGVEVTQRVSPAGHSSPATPSQDKAFCRLHSPAFQHSSIPAFQHSSIPAFQHCTRPDRNRRGNTLNIGY